MRTIQMPGLLTFVLVALTTRIAAQDLRLDQTGAFFTHHLATEDNTIAATTTAGAITGESFTSYAGNRKSSRVLENLGFDVVLRLECDARGLARTATTLARSLAMRRTLESQQRPDGIGGSLARFATDELRSLRISALVGASRAIDDAALHARFQHRYGVDGIRVTVRHILCSKDANHAQSAEQRAHALHSRLTNGETFESLLVESDDRITRRTLRNPRRTSGAGILVGYNYYRYGKSFAEAVRALKVGAFSPPTASPIGIHLIQVVERKVTRLAQVEAVLRKELGGGKARSSEILALRDALLAKYQFQPKIEFARHAARPHNSQGLSNPSPNEWPHYRGNPQLHGAASGVIGSSPTLAWTFQTNGEILSSPVVFNNTVYVGSTDNSVYAIDLTTGKKRWAFATQDMVEAPPLVLDNRIYIGSSDFFFYALDANSGDLIWKFETEDKILGGANWFVSKDTNKRIVVGSYDARVYCFDIDGEKQWSYETDNYVHGSPAIYNREIVFGGCDAGLHLVDGETGERVTKIELGSGCQVAGSVALLGDKAYFGHYGNEFLRIDLESGKVDWRYPGKRQGFCSSPALNDKYVVFGGRDKNLHCVLRENGTPQWQYKTRRKVDASAVIAGDKVVFGSGDGRIYMLSLAQGKELWTYDIGKPVYSSPAVVDGMIIIGASDQRIYAFRAPADKRPAKQGR